MSRLMACLVLLLAAIPAFAGPMAVQRLRCEYAVNPLGVDAAKPRLMWEPASGRRSERQTAYRVLAASSLEKLRRDAGDLWDSGRVASDRTLHVPYAGRPLRSSQRVWWKVRAWDRDGRPTVWSAPALWTMGVLRPADWRAGWIGAESAKARAYETMLLRREFTVRLGLRRAVAHVCGLGHYEMTLNGRRVGRDLLAPGWTKYDRTCLYDTHDVTGLLRAGGNAAGLFLGNGMFNVHGGRYTKFTGTFGPLKAIAQIRLEYADGTAETVGTGPAWKIAPGPVTFSCVYGGEDHDARREQSGWDRPGFDDRGWDRAAVLKGPGGALRGLSCAAPPIRAIEMRKPVRVREIRPGVAVYDMGQNAPFIPRLRVRGPAGASVRIIPAELIHADGTVDRGSSGGGEAYWQYTLAGRGRETWFPRFFYHGCRYLQVERKAGDGGALPVVEGLEGVVVHSSSPPVGRFACSSDLFNRIHTLVRWAQRANMMHVLTDCPHRERLGWLEQYHLNGPALRCEFDLARMFAKGMNDMADSQLESGLVPDIAPEYTVFSGGFRDSPEWGSAFLLVPWQQYEWTGDMGLLRAHYPRMKRYVEYLGRTAKDHIVSHGLGDWYDLGPNPPGVAQLTPIALTATAFYYEDARILAQTAALLGHREDARRYGDLAASIRTAFNRAFYNPATGRYGDSQAGNAIVLVMGLAEPERRAGALAGIVEDLRKRDYALTAGDVGYRYLLRALADGGRSDLIFAMNNRTDKPGYGYQLRMGATSLTEAWDAGRASSQNHFMLGHIVEWLYHDLAGIGGDPAGPGFRRIVIRPQPVGDIAWARASLHTVRGAVASAWSRKDGVFTLSVRVPPGATATVHVPAARPGRVTEGGKPAARAEGVRFLRQEGGAAVYEVGSGAYTFRVRS